MAIAFETYGPFKLRREKAYVSRDALSDFWDEISEVAPGLEDAVGVYLFTVKHGSSVTPWYVGKTDAGFRKRFAGHAAGFKLFVGLAGKAPKGQLEVMFFARRTTKGTKFKAPSVKNLGSIDSLEQLLIGSCFAKNKHLLNVQRMGIYKNLKVPGYMNEGKGKPTSSATSLRKILA